MSIPVMPGDAMSTSVVANGSGAFTLTLTDSTQGWTQATSQISDITPSALTGGTAFSVIWDSSGTTATATAGPPASAPAPPVTGPGTRLRRYAAPAPPPLV